MYLNYENHLRIRVLPGKMPIISSYSKISFTTTELKVDMKLKFLFFNIKVHENC